MKKRSLPPGLGVGKQLHIGRTIVTVDEMLAQGGFGVVLLTHKYYDPTRKLAVKRMVVLPEDIDACRREIQITKAVSGHPNIINFVDSSIVRHGEQIEVMMAMSFYAESLAALLQHCVTSRRHFSEAMLLHLLADLIQALHRCHGNAPTPIVHRDVKVENVLRAAAGRPWVLCDFGSATYFLNDAGRSSATASIEDEIGKCTTLAYRAPEMVNLYSGHVIGPKADIWALGCLLYSLCFHVLPFGDSSVLAIQSGNFAPPPDGQPYATRLVALICYMLTPDPSDRPSTRQLAALMGQLAPQRELDVPPAQDAPSLATLVERYFDGEGHFRPRQQSLPTGDVRLQPPGETTTTTTTIAPRERPPRLRTPLNPTRPMDRQQFAPPLPPSGLVGQANKAAAAVSASPRRISTPEESRRKDENGFFKMMMSPKSEHRSKTLHHQEQRQQVQQQLVQQHPVFQAHLQKPDIQQHHQVFPNQQHSKSSFDNQSELKGVLFTRNSIDDEDFDPRSGEITESSNAREISSNQPRYNNSTRIPGGEIGLSSQNQPSAIVDTSLFLDDFDPRAADVKLLDLNSDPYVSNQQQQNQNLPFPIHYLQNSLPQQTFVQSQQPDQQEKQHPLSQSQPIYTAPVESSAVFSDDNPFMLVRSNGFVDAESVQHNAAAIQSDPFVLVNNNASESKSTATLLNKHFTSTNNTSSTTGSSLATSDKTATTANKSSTASKAATLPPRKFYVSIRSCDERRGSDCAEEPKWTLDPPAAKGRIRQSQSLFQLGHRRVQSLDTTSLLGGSADIKRSSLDSIDSIGSAAANQRATNTSDVSPTNERSALASGATGAANEHHISSLLAVVVPSTRRSGGQSKSVNSTPVHSPHSVRRASGVASGASKDEEESGSRTDDGDSVSNLSERFVAGHFGSNSSLKNVKSEENLAIPDDNDEDAERLAQEVNPGPALPKQLARQTDQSKYTKLGSPQLSDQPPSTTTNSLERNRPKTKSEGYAKLTDDVVDGCDVITEQKRDIAKRVDVKSLKSLNEVGDAKRDVQSARCTSLPPPFAAPAAATHRKPGAGLHKTVDADFDLMIERDLEENESSGCNPFGEPEPLLQSDAASRPTSIKSRAINMVGDVFAMAPFPAKLRRNPSRNPKVGGYGAFDEAKTPTPDDGLGDGGKGGTLKGVFAGFEAGDATWADFGDADNGRPLIKVENKESIVTSGDDVKPTEVLKFPLASDCFSKANTFPKTDGFVSLDKPFCSDNEPLVNSKRQSNDEYLGRQADLSSLQPIKPLDSVLLTPASTQQPQPPQQPPQQLQQPFVQHNLSHPLFQSKRASTTPMFRSHATNPVQPAAAAVIQQTALIPAVGQQQPPAAKSHVTPAVDAQPHDVESKGFANKPTVCAPLQIASKVSTQPRQDQPQPSQPDISSQVICTDSPQQTIVTPVKPKKSKTPAKVLSKTPAKKAGDSDESSTLVSSKSRKKKSVDESIFANPSFVDQFADDDDGRRDVADDAP